MASFTNLNKETVKKTSRRFQRRLEALIEANGIFLLFQDIFMEIWWIYLLKWDVNVIFIFCVVWTTIYPSHQIDR